MPIVIPLELTFPEVLLIEKSLSALAQSATPAQRVIINVIAKKIRGNEFIRAYYKESQH